MAGKVEFDFSNFKDFIKRLEKAASGAFKEELTLFMQGLGTEFLRIVQDEIIRTKTMNTRLLLASFHEGGSGNVWEISEGGLTLEVGTNVEYATFVNDGHWANPKGVERRFIPGRWVGDRFIYEPGAKTGMVLKQQWIEGSHYFDSAVRIIEKMFPKLMEEMLERWIAKFFT